jgi:DNA-directed RNA polymerase specialized sigma24 family protein
VPTPCSSWLYGTASNLIARHHRTEMRRHRALARTGVAPAVDGHAELAATRLDARPRWAL